jgi:hypothetical protein
LLLPNGERARVDRSKIADYLLALSHPDGRSKAEFFLRFGFTVEQWNVLAEALRAVGTSNPVSSVAQSKYGLRYTVDGVLRAPDGREPKVRTVWITTPDDDAPRLVTAYPLQESE